MSYLHNLLFYQPITPLHIGCGQDVGVVDLPVIRERTTGYPFIPGSGIRGSLRQVFARQRPGAFVSLLFGPTAEESETGPRHAGCVAVHDARLLLFPVRSDQAPFLWITCPAVLQRFSRDARVLLGEPGNWPVEAPAAPAPEEAFGAFSGTVYLEEMGFQMPGRQDGEPEAAAAGFSTWLAALGSVLEIQDLPARTVVVSDDAFHYLVTHATQVLQHNRLTSAKTVAQGQLFSVEAVPPEAVFYGFLGATEPRRPKDGEGEAESGGVAATEEREAEGEAAPSTREEALQTLRGVFTGRGAGAWVQLGGDEGTGLGVTRLVWTDGEAADAPEAAHAS